MAYPASTEPRGIASYAWGDDYHSVLTERLRLLVSFIERQVGHPIPNRWYCDSGPILERDLAQRAGLGWIGKNTCLINPEFGSYFFLAELLLSLTIEPDAPYTADRCGTCARCITACPTGCIMLDRSIDARRCISYLTIELKGSIPVELRALTGQWIFGCDVCQQVCPWNRHKRMARRRENIEAAFIARTGIQKLDLQQEIALTADEFMVKFKGSAVKRTKRRGYLRNVALALCNSGNRDAIPAMIHALKNDPEALVRGHVAWALGRAGGEPAHQALTEALQTEQDATVLAEIQAALRLIL
jgi:epoxyqueuosine reductase